MTDSKIPMDEVSSFPSSSSSPQKASENVSLWEEMKRHKKNDNNEIIGEIVVGALAAVPSNNNDPASPVYIGCALRNLQRDDYSLDGGIAAAKQRAIQSFQDPSNMKNKEIADKVKRKYKAQIGKFIRRCQAYYKGRDIVF